MAREEGKEEGIEIGLETGLKVGDKKALIMRDEGIEFGIKVGKKDGLEEGRIKEKLEMAKKSKEKGLATELIVELTGLTKAEINKL